jgi:hypothetical protein
MKTYLIIFAILGILGYVAFSGASEVQAKRTAELDEVTSFAFTTNQKTK